jgi:hypothetical protein
MLSHGNHQWPKMGNLAFIPAYCMFIQTGGGQIPVCRVQAVETKIFKAIIRNTFFELHMRLLVFLEYHSF